MPCAFTKRAPFTCSSMRYWGLRPLMRLVNRMASGPGTTCEAPPGKRMIGQEHNSLILLVILEKCGFEINDPPMRRTSAPCKKDCWACSMTTSGGAESGSMRTLKRQPFFDLRSNMSSSMGPRTHLQIGFYNYWCLGEYEIFLRRVFTTCLSSVGFSPTFSTNKAS